MDLFQQQQQRRRWFFIPFIMFLVEILPSTVDSYNLIVNPITIVKRPENSSDVFFGQALKLTNEKAERFDLKYFRKSNYKSSTRF